jgi:hypothetical protein
MSKIKLNNVRLSFPSLFQKATFEGKETKFEATLLLDKKQHAESIAEIQAAIKVAIKEKLGNAKVGADKLCIKDGDESDYEGYAGNYSLKAANAKRPLVIDRDKPFGDAGANASVNDFDAFDDESDDDIFG